MIKRILILAIAVSLLGAFSGHVLAGKNHDDVPGRECQHQAPEHNPHCNPSETPSVSPSVTATPTPSPTETCILVLDGEFQSCEEVSVTPTVTEVPSATPTPPTCGEGEHMNLQGDKCLRFELGGAPSSDEQGTPFQMKGEDKVHGVQK